MLMTSTVEAAAAAIARPSVNNRVKYFKLTLS